MAGFNINSKNFGKLLIQNSYELARCKGSHHIYKHRHDGTVIAVPNNLNPIIAERLVKQYKLIINK